MNTYIPDSFGGTNFNKKILWIGNSQLNSVNQGNLDTTKTASHIASEYFYDKNIIKIIIV